MSSEENSEDGKVPEDSKKDEIKTSGFSTRSASKSLVEYYGHGLNSCGYCKREGEECEGRRSYDMKAYRLTPNDYQQLLDRGWRRSGNYCYCPINTHTCCPNFPISCEALEFELSRSQRRCIENLNSFLINGRTNTSNESIRDKIFYKNSCDIDSLRDEASEISKRFEKLRISSKARTRRFVKSCDRKVNLYNVSLEEAITRTMKRSQKIRNKPPLEEYLYPTKAKWTTNNEDGTIQVKHQLQIRLIHAECQESMDMREKQHDVVQRYQASVHKENPEEWSMSRYRDFLIYSPIIVKPIEDRDYSNDKFSDTLSKDLCPDQSKYLLVKPPELPTSYGTYHCVYLLDGKLIAVGVLDILTKCITTVYFFYDPSYSYLNLGIYSALVEISLVRQMADHYSGPKEKNKLVHYYMGFYVHECKKMRYKTRFRPSYLLCSETCQYVPTEICLKKLEGKKYVRFSTDSNTDFDIHKQVVTYEDASKISIVSPINGITKMIDYFRWLRSNLGEGYVDILFNNLIVQYIRLIGAPLVQNLTLRVNAVHQALVEKHRKSRASVPTKRLSM